MFQRFPNLFKYLLFLILGGLLLTPVITYATLTLESALLSGDGALTIKSASSSATTLGDPDQSGTITIASSTQTLTLNLGVGSGATTVNIATGTSTAKTINIGTGAQVQNTITIGNASSSIAVSGTLRITEGNQGAGKSLYSDASGGATWQTPSSTEFTYNEFTANVSVTATTEASSTVVVTATAYTFDGTTTVLIEFFSPRVTPPDAVQGHITIVLFEDGNAIGWLANTQNDLSDIPDSDPIEASRRMTPTAASHTYSVRAFSNSAGGEVRAGLGGAGTLFPGFIRISKAN